MIFQAVSLHHVRIPLHEPFRIANGEVGVKDAILVAATTDEGVTGWGEASPMSGGFYSKETPESTWQTLADDLAPALFAMGEIDPVRCADLLAGYPREPFARAGLEGAVWDAHARTIGEPLWKLLGGSAREVPSGLAVGLYPSIDELLAAIARELPRGYVRLKIKIEPGWDIEPLRAVRAKFGDIPLMVDANASYRLDEHRATLLALDAFDLMMIEQPLAKEAFVDLAELQRSLRTPLCADESAFSPDALDVLIEQRSVRIVNIKIQRVGGLHAARLMAERAAAAGLGVWLGTMPELGVATHQGVHLATHPAFTLPSDVHPSERWFVDEITAPPVVMSSPGGIAPQEWRVNDDVVRRYGVATWRFEP